MEERSWIMAVDDDHTYLDMIGGIIGEYYNVTLANSGKQALDILRNGKAPDLIMLDIVMPDMDGYETFAHICEMKELSGIPIIFLTGKADSADELAGFELGAQDYIVKPFVWENLLARIRLRLESGKQTRQLLSLRERLQETEKEQERFSALLQKLTPTEQKVAQLLLLGCDNQEISTQLNYTNGYVKNMSTRIYSKLGVCSRSGLWKLYQNR